MTKIAIIGGGAAGMMAAAQLCESSKGNKVFLIERNAILGQKVIISGGGRCNVTTGLTDLKEILKNYPRGAKFLRTAMYAFPPAELIKWIEARNVPLKEEEDKRIFPKSNKGIDIVKLFEKIFHKSKVKILYKTALNNVSKKADKFILELSSNQTLEVDKLILTTGGQAYRHTGSQGDGYSFAEALGHKITKLGPSLNSFITKEEWTKGLSGISFPHVKLKFVGKEKFEFTGPIMLTHKGVTGPATFALSALAAFEHFEKNLPAKLFIDFKPDDTYKTITEEIKNELAASQKKQTQNSLHNWMPKSFIKAILKENEISPEKTNSELGKKALNKIVEALKNSELTLIGRAAGDEFVTAGGIELSEVNPKTMESKICHGLFFGGEILNIDGFTGGYNLQVAWATGRLAGKHAGK